VAYLGSVNTFGNRKKLSLDPRCYYFKSKMLHAGYFDENLIIDCAMKPKDGYEKFKKYIETHDTLPTGLFIASDAIVPGVMKCLSEYNLSVPDDISIVTFNNTNLSEFATPPLTSIEVFMVESVRSAIFCMEHIRQSDFGPKKVVVPCELVDRGSVKQI
jgi:LacI family transcriptional regulator